MTVTNVAKDTDALTLAITAEFDAPVDRVWQLWDDPRQLERWWGPPSHPATFVEHELRPGGRASYYMTSPEGEKYHGWWVVVAVDAPRRIEIEDGFADDRGARNDDLPISRMQVDVEARDGGGTRMTITSTFPSAAEMEQILAMGMEEGMTLAVGQIDAILAG
jgi:uncharacterized protein YndB with AHSA1/START domain